MRESIYIDHKSSPLITAEGIHMSMREMFVERQGALTPVRHIERFDNVTDVDLFMLLPGGLSRLNATALVRANIAQFLREQHARVEMDYMCFNFAHQMAFGEPRPKHNHSGDPYWKYIPIHAAWLLPRGAIIKLHRGTENGRTPFAHAAVYLGKRLFISVYGAGGDLEVSTLDDMKRDFKAPYVVRSIPKTPPNTR